MLRRILLPACAALISGALVAVPAAEGASQGLQKAPVSALRAPGTSGMDVWNYNITGAGTNQNNRNDINNGGAPRAVRPVTNAIAAGARPDVIALQEVCQTQAAYLRPKLRNAGYRVHWRATKTQSRCAAYKNYDPKVSRLHGDLVAVPASYSPTKYAYDFNLDTTTPTGEGLTCFGFTKLSRFVVACSTQLAGTNAQRLNATFRMRRDEIEPWADQGFGVIIAGDFNTKPDQEPMKNLYHRNGILSEGDQARNRWTHQNRKAPFAKRKIDYVFFSNNYFPASSYYSVLDGKPEYSYHRFYAASATMR